MRVTYGRFTLGNFDQPLMLAYSLRLENASNLVPFVRWSKRILFRDVFARHLIGVEFVEGNSTSNCWFTSPTLDMWILGSVFSYYGNSIARYCMRPQWIPCERHNALHSLIGQSNFQFSFILWHWRFNGVACWIYLCPQVRTMKYVTNPRRDGIRITDRQCTPGSARSSARSSAGIMLR